MAEGKKITDIVPPDGAKEDTKDVSPSISKHAAGATIGAKDDNNPTDTVSTNAETQDDSQQEEVKKPVSNDGVSIKPVSDDLTPGSDAVNDDKTEPETEPEKEVSDFVSNPESSDEATQTSAKESGQETNTEPEESPKSSEKQPYEAQDSLPDENDKKTSEATDEMQTPKVYDTKEYHVPIKNTSHSHGGAGIIIAGIITALVVAAAVALVAIYWF